MAEGPLRHRLDRAHQPARDPGRARVREGRPGRRREPRPDPRRGVREEVGDRAGIRLLRGAARGPRRRRRLHLAAQHDARRVVDQRASRRASTSSARSRSAATPRRSSRPSTRRSAPAACSREAFMYRHNPQTARLVELVRERRDRRAPGRPGRVQLLALRRGQHPAPHRRRGREPDGRRLLLRERVAPARRRAGERARPGVHRADRDGLGLHREHGFPRRCPRTLRLRHVPPGPRRAGGDRHRGVALPRRPVALPDAGDRAARGTSGIERIELEPVDSYRLEVENLADAISGEAPLLLGREDAVAQARALEALHRSAETAAPVQPLAAAR